jgi:hypothetical protein
MTIIISRKSPVTGKTNQRKVDITHDQYLEWLGGKLIQDVSSTLTVDDREFMISGCTPTDFDYLYPEDK